MASPNASSRSSHGTRSVRCSVCCSVRCSVCCSVCCSLCTWDIRSSSGHGTRSVCCSVSCSVCCSVCCSLCTWDIRSSFSHRTRPAVAEVQHMQQGRMPREHGSEVFHLLNFLDLSFSDEFQKNTTKNSQSKRFCWTGWFLKFVRRVLRS